MALQYTTITERGWAGGVDAASPANNIKQGFVEACQNMIPSEDGLLRKRQGYVTYGGGIPFRASRVDTNATGTGYIITLETGINLTNVRSVPLLICGRMGTSAGAGTWGDFSFTEDRCVYFTNSSENPRRVVSAGTTVTISLLAEESGLTSTSAIAQIAESTSLVNSDCELVYPDVKISSSTYDVTAAMTNGTSSAKYFFMYVLNTETTTLGHYVYTSAGATSHVIPLSTHNLPNANFLIRCYDSNDFEIFPEIAVDSTQQITITDAQSAVRRAIIVSCEDDHLETGTVAAYSTQTIVFTGITTPYIFAECYLETSPGNYERCQPDTVVVDSTAMTATLTFTNNTSSTGSFIAYWTAVNITARIELLTATVNPTAGLTDLQPQLVIYGLDHETAYLNAGTRAGRVTALDNYKTVGDEHLVCGLGGALFKYLVAAEAVGTIYEMPTWYPAQRGRVDSTVVVGPVFSPAASTRTSGYVAFDEVSAEGYATGTSLEWDAVVGGGSLKITIPATNLSTSGTPIRTRIADTYHDILTISQAPYSVLEGSWDVVKVEYGVASIILWIDSNGVLESSDFDLTSCSIRCGIFSDVIPFSTSQVWIRPGDVLNSDVFGTLEPEAISYEPGTPLNIRFDGFTSLVTVPSGLLLVSKRFNSNVIQLQTSSGADVTPALFNVVCGDMIEITGIDRQLRVVRAYPGAAESVSITGDGTTATVTLTSSENLTVGQYVPIYGVQFQGVHQITAIQSTTTFTFASTEVGSSVSATMAGSFIEVDEFVSELEGSTANATTIKVHSRWQSIEAKYSSASDAGQRTYPSYFPYVASDEQYPIRSVMAGNNMYFTNGVDAVMKYDGTNIMKAGLPRWQPQAFILQSTYSGDSKIPYTGVSTYFTKISTYGFAYSTEVIGTETQFTQGMKITYSGASTNTVRSNSKGKTLGGSDIGVVTFDGDFPYSSFIGYQLLTYRYYFRLNYIDANGNTIFTATSGSTDTVTPMWRTVQIKIRLVGLPAFDGIPLDFTRIELEVYRTKADEAGPYYRVKNVDVSFSTGYGYIDVEDYTSDDALLPSDWDKDVSSVFGAEIAPSLSSPPIAEYITTASNRLLLGNITSNYTLDFKMISTGTRALTAADLHGKTIIIRKDNTDTGTTSNMTDRIVLEFVKESPTINVITAASIGDTTTFTCAGIGAILSVGDWVYLTRGGTLERSRFAGWYPVTAKSTDTISIYTPGASSSPAWDNFRDVDRIVYASTPTRIPVYCAGTDYTFGDMYGRQGTFSSTLPTIESLAMRRVAIAINAAMALARTSTTYTTFKPWLSAFGGNDYPSGAIQLEIPGPITTIPEIVIPDLASSVVKMFVNNVSRAAAAEISFLQYLYPARVVISLPKFPEVFNAPFGAPSQYVVDVNAEDGQEITGMIPLFSTSAFSASQKDASVVVFKERSIYILNPETGEIRRLETDGVGCTFPYSIAITRGGIAFANEAGIFRLNYNLTVDFIGSKLDDEWDGAANVELVQGHHFSREQQYKVSSSNNSVWVYNYRSEEEIGVGGWGKYTNHKVTSWCNQQRDEFHGSTVGRVFKTRYNGDNTDFRDDASAIDAYTTFRAMDFGEPGTRKQARHVEIGYATQSLTTTGNKLYCSINLLTSETELSSVTTASSTNRKADTRQYGIPNGRFMYLQLRVKNATIDEPLEIVSIAYRVVGLTEKRNPEAGR